MPVRDVGIGLVDGGAGGAQRGLSVSGIVWPNPRMDGRSRGRRGLRVRGGGGEGVGCERGRRGGYSLERPWLRARGRRRCLEISAGIGCGRAASSVRIGGGGPGRRQRVLRSRWSGRARRPDGGVKEEAGSGATGAGRDRSTLRALRSTSPDAGRRWRHREVAAEAGALRPPPRPWSRTCRVRLRALVPLPVESSGRKLYDRSAVRVVLSSRSRIDPSVRAGDLPSRCDPATGGRPVPAVSGASRVLDRARPDRPRPESAASGAGRVRGRGADQVRRRPRPGLPGSRAERSEWAVPRAERAR